MVHVVNGNDLTVFEDTGVHSTPISCMRWNSTGTRLVTADKVGTRASSRQLMAGIAATVRESASVCACVRACVRVWHRQAGVVGVWRMDQRGRLIPMCSYRKSGAITHIAFESVPADDSKACVLTGLCLAVCRSTVLTLALCVHRCGASCCRDTLKECSFFMCGVSGVVFYADDMGNSPDTGINLSAGVNVMEFYGEKRVLVIVTAALMMTQVQVRCRRVAISGGATVT
jgi:hypothetical protein